MFQRRMLSKDDEATGSEETEVRREDQEKINRFSRLHQREAVLEAQLKAKLIRKISRKFPPNLTSPTRMFQSHTKIGDSFMSLPLSEAQEMLAASTEKIDNEVSDLEEKLGALKEEAQQLKIALYARFGKSINLET
ncbi:prefoldin subunit 4 [Trichophyton tonsurans CBS 112818]|uniref:Prefoldin subunit 4 n=1 Tax=Trichophyton tonsurans (strain CBS 112818) TaxID=647933 RepID=F2S1C0_TRIT1|nr:prefoldin subunit 4 [Trichophyton tonsurans CBS 112818]